MRRFLFPLLMLSFGLNLGLLYHQFTDRGPDRWSRRPPMPFPREDGRRPEPRDVADPQRGIRHRTEFLGRTLGLDGEQRARMSAVLERTVPRIVEGQSAMTKARRSLHEAVAEPPLDAEEFRRRVGALNRAQAELDSLVAESMLEEASVLTPEQRRRYLELSPFGAGGGGRGRKR